MNSRWVRVRNMPTILVAANSVSYATTFIRERFYYQRELGLATLDHIVIAVSVAAVISNVIGTATSLSWAAGRLDSRRLSLGSLFGGMLIVTAIFAHDAGFYWLVLIFASSAFIIESQRASQNGRLIYALAAAITAPVPTIFIWSIEGTHSARYVIAGYAAGAVWQALGAMLAGRGATIKRVERGTESWWLPLLYVGAIQCDAVVDQVLFLRAGPGWAGAGTMAFTISAASVVIFLGPLSSQALAGRIVIGKLRNVFLVGFSIALAFEFTIFVSLSLILRGGHLNGSELSRLRALTMLYGMVIPFSFGWQLLSRIAHRTVHRWQSMSVQSVLIFGIHAIVLVPLFIFHLWYEFPFASVVALGAGCLMIARPHLEVGPFS